ncbi:MAG: hypothetical protein Q7S57_01930 [bacterium]|nr:hypothetical protein [bacterium]
MHKATECNSGVAANLLVRIACLVVQSVIREVKPTNEQGLLVVLDGVVEWSRVSESCEAFVAVGENLDDALFHCGRKVADNSPEAVLSRMVEHIVSAALHLEPAWLARQSSDSASHWIMAGASTAHFYAYHEAAEVQSALTGKPFRCIQRPLTEQIIIPALVEAGLGLHGVEPAGPRIVLGAHRREIVSEKV